MKLCVCALSRTEAGAPSKSADREESVCVGKGGETEIVACTPDPFAFVDVPALPRPGRLQRDARRDV